MDEQQQKEIAVFRFGVISDFVNRNHMSHGEQARLLKEKCEKEWQIPHSPRTRLSPTTILHWIKLYKKGAGRLESLYPQSRKDKGGTRAIDQETGQALIRLRKELPASPVTMLLKEMEDRRLLKPGTILPPATVYRFLHRHGLLRPAAPSPVDRRKFEAEHPNDIWQSDAMHGPMVTVAGKKRKTYLFAFLDDMSRLIPHAEFYLSERLDSYLGALRSALLKRGLPRKLYVDNGPAFRSALLREITASLGIALVHSRPYQPEGRGKVERAFRTIRTQFLPGFKGDSLDDLNEALDCWIRDVYHSRPHGATGQPPLRRFADHMECIRPAPKDLEDSFRSRARRTVAKDRTVSLDGKLYEAPIPLIGKQITLLYHNHDPARVEILLEGRSHGFLTPLDLNVNCRVRRHSHRLCLESSPEKSIPTGRLSFGTIEQEDSR
jgi:putative transposase